MSLNVNWFDVEKY